MRRLIWLILVGLAMSGGFAGLGSLQNGVNQKKLGELLGGIFSKASHRSDPTAPPPPRGNDTIRIATFNIRVFGETKLNDTEAMQAIVAILRNFDLIAIQEVRAISQDVVPHLVALLNSDGKSHYDYAIGPRL